MEHVTVIGAGSWGTALALAAHRAGSRVSLWGRQLDRMADMAQSRENTLHLAGIPLPEDMTITADRAVISQATILILAVPAQKMRFVTQDLASHIPTQTPLIVTAKGIEGATLALMSDVLAETLPANPTAVLSGPTFAMEVARAQPTAATLACGDALLGTRLMRALSSETFRLYGSEDIVGAQVGGALKNVLAIAAGIASGLGHGENARAALLTRGLAEVTRFGLALGAAHETFMGLCGIGDLMLTCLSPTSRNFRYGQALGQGLAPGATFEDGTLVEGVFSTASVMAIAEKLQIRMPICAAVDAILNHGLSIHKVTTQLLNRPMTKEIDF